MLLVFSYASVVVFVFVIVGVAVARASTLSRYATSEREAVAA